MPRHAPSHAAGRRQSRGPMTRFMLNGPSGVSTEQGRQHQYERRRRHRHHLPFPAPGRPPHWSRAKSPYPTSAADPRRCAARSSTSSGPRRDRTRPRVVPAPGAGLQPERVAVHHVERLGPQQIQRRATPPPVSSKVAFAREDRARPRPPGEQDALRAVRRARSALTTTRSTPAAASRSSAWSSNALPASVSSGLAVRSVSGRMRVPSPAASIMARVRPDHAARAAGLGAFGCRGRQTARGGDCRRRKGSPRRATFEVTGAEDRHYARCAVALESPASFMDRSRGGGEALPPGAMPISWA